MSDILIEKDLRRLRLVHRTGHERLPKQLLHLQLYERKGNQGKARLRYKDVAKFNMKLREHKEMAKEGEKQSCMEVSNKTQTIRQSLSK